MLEAHNLGRRYGDFSAVDGVSFSVREGEIVGLLGPNGAGKTTTIRMLTGFLPPTSGRVTLDGADLFEAPVTVRRRLGYLPENVALYPEMRVEEYLSYRARLEGVPRATAKGALSGALERCLLTEVRRQVIGTLSKGYRQRVGLASAILHEPRVLVLDEPTVGLDPNQIIAIRELIRELGKDRTLILSTHILPEVELLCNRVLIIDRGRIVAEGTPETLRQRAQGSAVVRVLVEGAPPEAAAVFAEIPGVVGVDPSASEPGRFALGAAPDADLRAAIFQTAVQKGWTLLELAQDRASLEDVFVRLTTHAPAAEATNGNERESEVAP